MSFCLPFLKNKTMILNMELSGIFYLCSFSYDNNFSFSLFLVCHFQFSESVDCNLAAYMYLCLYSIFGTQPPGQK